MTGNRLQALIIDDDAEVLNQLERLLPSEIDNTAIDWERADSFADGLDKIKTRLYDIVVTDVYDGKPLLGHSNLMGDDEGRNVVDFIKGIRFCPILVYSGGAQPVWCPTDHPFIQFVDKSKLVSKQAITKALEPLFEVGIPRISRQIHDDLDQMAGEFMWKFLAPRWNHVKAAHAADPQHLERVLRRRSSIHLSKYRLDGENPIHRTDAEPVDYYLYPPVSKNLRLGSLLRSKTDKTFKVILTPHCDLVTRSAGSDSDRAMPKADFILLADTSDASVRMRDFAGKVATNNSKANVTAMRRGAGLPADLSDIKPEGRWCFLPGFLDIPDLYLDLMRLHSVPVQEVFDLFDHVADLDTPFAEGLQSAFTRLYSRVGLPDPSLEALSKSMGIVRDSGTQ